MSVFEDLSWRWRCWKREAREKFDNKMLDHKYEVRGCASCLVGIVSFVGLVVFGLLSLLLPAVFVVPFLFCVMVFGRCFVLFFWGGRPT